MYFQRLYCVVLIIAGPVYVTRNPGGEISFPVAQPVTLTCTSSNDPTGNLSYSWSSSCSPACDSDVSSTNQSELLVTVLRARDTGNYTCTITDDGIIVGKSTATICRVEGIHFFLWLLSVFLLK